MREYNKRMLGSQATGEVQKQHLLNMLIAFDSFCKEHGLRYYLCGGTLLGAIRHQGFIPWDDDIDVNMPRPDCERLMELSGGRIGNYIVNPPNYTDTYHAYHWKIYDDSILVAKKAGKNLYSKVYPPFIDIFPIEGLPDTEAKNKRHYRKIFIWKALASSLWGKKWFHGSSVISKLFHGFTYPIAMLIGKKRLFNRVIGVAKSIPFDESDYIGVMMTNVHTTEERVLKAEYMPVIDVNFEGHVFPGPAGYDTYLTQLYGADYMQLPPEGKRRPSHMLTPFYRQPESASMSTNEEGIKIAICGLIKSDNLGEMFIERSLEYLIETESRTRGLCEPLTFVEVDLLGRKEITAAVKGSIKRRLQNYQYYSRSGVPLEYVYIKLKRIADRIKNQKIRNDIHRLRHHMWQHGRNYRKRLYKYFSEKMEDAVFIVVDGAGLLEYSYNEYQEPLLLLSQYAKTHGKQIVYNAIGRAGDFDETDFRSTILKRALQAECVKYVSARDSVETVQICAGEKHQVKLLADAAFWMKEAYRMHDIDRREKVGIGIIRGNSLQGYGVNFDANAWVELFSGIARVLTDRGYAFEFFTNGLQGDIRLGKRILRNMELPTEYLVRRPISDVELYSTISRYIGLITCRMHSSIASFTLGIPTVILSWNDKVEKLMEIIGYPERAISRDQFDPGKIVDRFEAALDEGVGLEEIDAMKAKARESVTDYIDLILDAVKEAAAKDSSAKKAHQTEEQTAPEEQYALADA